MLRRKKVYTVDEVKSLVSALEAKSLRIPGLLGYNSRDIAKTFKQLVTLCNSLSIVFTHYSQHELSDFMLEKARTASSGLKRHGSPQDSAWSGRVLTIANYAYTLYRTEDLSEALHALYKAQYMLRTTPNASELAIAVHLLTFLTLWKLRRLTESSACLEQAGDLVTRILKEVQPSAFSQASLQNLFGVIVMGLACLFAYVENDFAKAVNECEQGLKQLPSANLAIKPLLETLCEKARQRSLDTDWLLSPELDKIFYASAFLPFVSRHTPRIHSTELTGIPIQVHQPSPRRSLSRSGRGYTRPWWDSNRLVDKVFNEVGAHRRYRSELRRTSRQGGPSRPLRLMKKLVEVSVDRPTAQVRLVPVDKISDLVR